MSSEAQKVTVIGSGAGGLLTALGLSNKGISSSIYEMASHFGGRFYSYEVNGYWVDEGLHVITRINSGPFIRFLRSNLRNIPEFIPHDGWYFRVYDREDTVPSSVFKALKWKLVDFSGRIQLLKVGAKIKTMSHEKMLRERNKTFAQFLDEHKITHKVLRDILESGLYLATGVPITEASAYESLMTLKDTDKNEPKLKAIKKILLGTNDYDEGYVIGGMGGLLSRILDGISGEKYLNSKVTQIDVEDGKVVGIHVNGEYIPTNYVVSNVPLWSLYKLLHGVDSETLNWFKSYSHMRATYGLTLWLGLKKKVLNDRKSRVIVYPRPSAWIVSTSAYDSTRAPEGKELVAVATILQKGENPQKKAELLKEEVLEKYHPDLLKYAEMEHLQHSYATRAALILGQTSLDRPGPRTPIKGLYIVGTDTAGKGVGLQHAANSALGAIDAILSDMEMNK